MMYSRRVQDASLKVKERPSDPISMARATKASGPVPLALEGSAEAMLREWFWQ